MRDLKKIILLGLMSVSLFAQNTPTIEQLRESTKDAKPDVLGKLSYKDNSVEEGVVLSLMSSLPTLYVIANDMHWAKCNDTWDGIDQKLKEYGATASWGMLIGLKYTKSEETEKLYKNIILSNRLMNCDDIEASKELAKLNNLPKPQGTIEIKKILEKK